MRRVRASRVTYVGELGWELYVPAEFAAHVFDRLVEAGREFGLPCRLSRHGRLPDREGLPALGPRHRRRTIPLEAGLGFRVAWDKPGGFHRPRQRSCAPRGGHATRRLVQLQLLDDAKLLYHEEPVWSGGRIAGSVTSGMYGHRVGAPLGMGYLTCADGVSQAWLDAQELEIEIAWERVPAKAQLSAWYDPRNERIRR